MTRPNCPCKRTPLRTARRGLVDLVVVVALAAVPPALAAHQLAESAMQWRLWAKVESIQAAGEPILVEDYATPPAPDPLNGALDLRAAVENVRPDSPGWQWVQEVDLDMPMPKEKLALTQKALTEIQPVLLRAQMAAKKPLIDWQIKIKSPLVSVLLPDLNHQRSLANVFHAAAVVAHEEGDDQKALDRLLDMSFLSRATAKQPALISFLVARGQGTLLTDTVSELCPRMDVGPAGAAGRKPASEAQLRKLIAELLDDNLVRDCMRRAMYFERTSVVDSMTNLAEAGEIPPLFDDDGPVLNQLADSFVAPVALWEACYAIDYHTEMMQALTAPSWPQCRQKIPPSPGSLHVLASMITPTFERAANHQYTWLTDRHLAAAQLAIRLYAADHGGDLPRALQDLVPKYLPAVPSDPMDAGQSPLHYDRQRSILWSVGDNGTDENGSKKNVGAGGTTRWQKEDAVVHLTLKANPN